MTGPCRSVAVSAYLARALEIVYQLEPLSVAVAINGVDASAFRPRGRRSGPRRRRFPVFGFVGRICVEKAPDTFLRACLLLAEQRHDFAVQLVGDTNWGRSEPTAIRRLVEELAAELQDKGIEVRRLGHVPREDVPGALRASDVHVVPSRWDEPCGLTILEGLATGIPIVASATGGSPELVGEAGLLFPRDDVVSLARRLASLLDDPVRRKELGLLARERARVADAGCAPGSPSSVRPVRMNPPDSARRSRPCCLRASVQSSEGPTVRTADGVTATPVWFGHARPTALRLVRVPRATEWSCAGVVICPPLAVEGTSSQPTLRFLSTRLAAEGCAVLRFDYAGTGDSSGDDREPARVAAWLASIRSPSSSWRRRDAPSSPLWACVSGRPWPRPSCRPGGRGRPPSCGIPIRRGGRSCASRGCWQRSWSRHGSGTTVRSRGRASSCRRRPSRISRDLKLAVDRLGRRSRPAPDQGRSARCRPTWSPQPSPSSVDWEEIEGQESLVDVDPVFAVTPRADGRRRSSGGCRRLSVSAGGLGWSRLSRPARWWVVTDDGQAISERPIALGPNSLFGIETAS